MERSLLKGGRRDIFLGTRECVGHVEAINEEAYLAAKSYYENQNLSFGIMFHSFSFPSSDNEKLQSYFTHTVMYNGIIHFKSQEECEFRNELSSYQIRPPKQIKPVDRELEDYNK